MGLVIVWLSFIILMSTSQELHSFDYFLFSVSALLLTCVHNFIEPFQISSNVFVLLSIFPNVIICYIILIYGNFLFILP